MQRDPTTSNPCRGMRDRTPVTLNAMRAHGATHVSSASRGLAEHSMERRESTGELAVLSPLATR